ncbi:hypothetical protein [Halalkalibacter akibai]|uniref:Uncharacterized protein n=1 Tax=Halalkalibacter akibai (strain ATCC 43226 / DSM 21942 / CIP 109018 / JCM 9157 / 1139) TaxID=1236973 RepID=W4QM93_HALA3|nr:hypothetical protein [Halalkalibacter akibai]GAE33245.1 hypothetical protein JCM9157_236 [Halalkalibacter akibai JCM 9157]
MTKAAVFGFIFVVICVLIPGGLGLYFADNDVDDSLSVPEIKEVIEPGHQQEEINLTGASQTFTREEAIELILEQFTFTELLNLYATVQNGMSAEEKKEILSLLQERFSEEEIEAIKVMGFAELEKVLQ